jgi:hypothetical protein
MGIGPKIGIVAFPWLALTIFLTLNFKSAFVYVGGGNRILFYIGLALIILGAMIGGIFVYQTLK